MTSNAQAFCYSAPASEPLADEFGSNVHRTIFVAVDLLWHRGHSLQLLHIPLFTRLENLGDKIAARLLFVRVAEMLLNSLAKSIDTASKLLFVVSNNELVIFVLRITRLCGENRSILRIFEASSRTRKGFGEVLGQG